MIYGVNAFTRPHNKKTTNITLNFIAVFMPLNLLGYVAHVVYKTSILDFMQLLRIGFAVRFETRAQIDCSCIFGLSNYIVVTQLKKI